MRDELRREHDDVRFDRLVDGELSETEYRTLLASLDDAALWRRCALAFLEAQALRGEMSGLRRPEAVAQPPKPVVLARHGAPRWLAVLVIAASFLAAFCGGLLVQQRFAPLAGDAKRMVQSGEPSGRRPAHQALRPSNALDDDEQEPPALGNIRLVVDGGTGIPPQPIEVPVYDLEQLGPQWLSENRPMLPANVVAALERRGRKVEIQMQLVPLPLDATHQIMLPVEQIQITPVSRRSY